MGDVSHGLSMQSSATNEAIIEEEEVVPSLASMGVGGEGCPWKTWWSIELAEGL